MSAEVQKTIKFVIRDRYKTEFSKRGNIFVDREEKSEQIKESMDSEYFVVGDPDFKSRYCTQKKRQRNKTMVEKHLSEEDTIFQTTLDQKNKISFYSSLQLNNEQQNSNLFEMQKRTLIKFRNQKNRQNKISKYLTNKLSNRLNKKIDSTLAYSTRKVQVFPNPDIDTIISDNIPQYWQQSLRVNNKRLMKHIEGNPYSKNAQQFLFQTIRGRRVLQESIPMIKLDFLNKGKSRTEESIDVKGYQIRRNKYQIDSLPVKNKNKQMAKLTCQQFLKVSHNNSYRY